MGFFSRIFGDNNRQSNQSTSTSTDTDYRVTDNRRALGEGARLVEAGGSMVTNDNDTSIVTYQSEEALAAVRDVVSSNERVNERSLDFATDAVELTAESILEASKTSTEALQEVTGQSLANSEKLALATLEAGERYIETASAAVRDGSEELTGQLIDALKIIGLAGAAAVALGVLK
jgi:hypothetical protein